MIACRTSSFCFFPLAGEECMASAEPEPFSQATLIWGARGDESE